MFKPLTAWSYSRYKAYVDCPLAFKHKHLMGKGSPSSPHLERGIAVHEKCAEFLEGKTNEPIDEIKQFDLSLFQDLKECSPTVEQQWGFDANWQSVPWFDRSTWLRVVLDAVAIHSDRTADVVDHKTGKMYDANDEQMQLFAAATFKKFPYLEHVTTRLWYLDAGEEVVAEYEKSEVDNLVVTWERKVKPMFADKEFLPRPSDKCRWCPISKSAGGECSYG